MTTSPSERCRSGEHVWFNVVPGLDRCVLCDAEIVDLDADPIVVEFGDEGGTHDDGSAVVPESGSAPEFSPGGCPGTTQ